MLLTNTKMLIGEVLGRMQKIDSNGDYIGLYNDMINGDIEVKRVHHYIITTLNNWVDEYGDDELKKLLKFANEIY
jgi:hypothetical protein